MRTKLFVVSAPSGAGKSSLCERALTEFSNLEDIITYTTRSMRPGESQGAPYHFVTKEEFLRLKENDFFIESATVHTNFYGTPRDVFDRAWSQGKYLIMDVDVVDIITKKSMTAVEVMDIMKMVTSVVEDTITEMITTVVVNTNK